MVAALSDKIIFLEIQTGEVFVSSPDGSDKKVLYAGPREWPDGVAVYKKTGVIYWTLMGPNPAGDDGSIVSVNPDGSDFKVVVPPGKTHTPKQLHIDQENGILYWCDREGMRVMRSKIDGSNVEILVDNRKETNDPSDWCVGITVDHSRGLLYWTQKGPSKGWKGRIFRAGLEIPSGETPKNRSDIEVLFDHMPEPIDLEIDEEKQVLYWTDRGDPPFGNSINRFSVAPQLGSTKTPHGPTTDLLITHKLHEGIGLALDIAHNRIFATDLLGGVYSTNLDGTNKKVIFEDSGNVTGITYIP